MQRTAGKAPELITWSSWTPGVDQTSSKSDFYVARRAHDVQEAYAQVVYYEDQLLRWNPPPPSLIADLAAVRTIRQDMTMVARAAHLRTQFEAISRKLRKSPFPRLDPHSDKFRAIGYDIEKAMVPRSADTIFTSRAQSCDLVARATTEKAQIDARFDNPLNRRRRLHGNLDLKGRYCQSETI